MLKVVTKGLSEPSRSGRHAVWAWAVIGSAGQDLGHGSGYMGCKPENTSNLATCLAIGKALRWCVDAGLCNLFVICDDLGVVKQLNGEPRLDHPALLTRARELLGQASAHVVWVPHTNIKDAETTARRLLMQKIKKQEEPEVCS